MNATKGAHRFTPANWVAALLTGKPVYRLGELARLAGQSESTARRAVLRLVRRRHLVRVGKGLFANILTRDGPPTVEDISGVLYPPAYISLDAGLFMHGICAQAPHVLTCVTTNKTKRFRTGLGEIQYHHVQPALFFGWSLTDGIPVGAAEKVILDTIYLERQLGRDPVIDEWTWDSIDIERLRDWAKAYPATVRAVLGVRV